MKLGVQLRLFRLPDRPEGLLFDMDMTLYRHEDYYRSQIKNQVEIVAAELGRSTDELECELESWQADWALAHEGKRPSFGNTLLGALGVSIDRSVTLRRQAIHPETYLVTDSRLQKTLSLLEQRFRLVLVTNNPTDVAERTLDALGVRRFFPRIVGLDESGESKPAPNAFLLGISALNCEASRVVSIGDRYAVDLEVPLLWGCGGVLVESMEDVYALPEVFSVTAKS